MCSRIKLFSKLNVDGFIAGDAAVNDIHICHGGTERGCDRTSVADAYPAKIPSISQKTGGYHIPRMVRMSSKGTTA